MDCWAFDKECYFIVIFVKHSNSQARFDAKLATLCHFSAYLNPKSCSAGRFCVSFGRFWHESWWSARGSLGVTPHPDRHFLNKNPDQHSLFSLRAGHKNLLCQISSELTRICCILHEFLSFSCKCRPISKPRGKNEWVSWSWRAILV